MHFRTDLEIMALEPQANGKTLIEATAADGTTVVLMVRVVEPLFVGNHLELVLLGEVQPPAPQPSVARSMRERVQGVQARTDTASSGQVPRSLNLTAPQTQNSPQAARANGDASSALLSSILGSPTPTQGTTETRDVESEMEALFGARKDR